jgi:hypothetical protein
LPDATRSVARLTLGGDKRTWRSTVGARSGGRGWTRRRTGTRREGGRPCRSVVAVGHRRHLLGVPRQTHRRPRTRGKGKSERQPGKPGRSVVAVRHRRYLLDGDGDGMARMPCDAARRPSGHIARVRSVERSSWLGTLSLVGSVSGRGCGRQRGILVVGLSGRNHGLRSPLYSASNFSPSGPSL